MKEHNQARQWREALNLTQAQLAELTGYSRLAIRCFEAGRTADSDKPRQDGTRSIAPQAWKRFKNVCAGIEYQIKQRKPFGW